jgi:precorrin-2 dehydrogenase/sirohydrochlorin ferrochelatase
LRKRPKKSSPSRKPKPRRAEGSPLKPRGKPRARAYYPAFIDLEGRPCVVVGGGRVAERKVSALLEAGARVTVVSPALTRGLSGKGSAGEIRHRARRFRPSDLGGVFLVIAATDSEEENTRISQAASEAGVPLVNVVDMPEHCGFIVPATVKRGPLTIAVSTSGASPAMARAIREELEGRYGPAFGKYLATLRRKREAALREMEDPEERERFLKSLVSADVLDALRRGKKPGGAKPGKKKK